MAGLKRIFSSTGAPLTDVRAAGLVFSSLLNGVGQATFRIPVTSRKCRQEFLGVGKLLLIEHDTLPPWIGVIDMPRNWTNHDVEINAYEITHLLKSRTVANGQEINGTPGELVRQLVNSANQEADTLIRMGSVFDGGAAYPIALTSGQCYDYIDSIAKQNSHEWLCRPSVDSKGNLNVYLDWVSKAGVYTDLILKQGFNLVSGDSPYEESGEIVNVIHAYNDQQGENPLSLVVFDNQSIAKHGVRSKQFVYPDLIDDASLRSAANNELVATSQPVVAVPLTAVNKGNTFSQIRLGNYFTQSNSRAGFDGQGLGQTQRLRILGFRYVDADQTCEIMAGR